MDDEARKKAMSGRVTSPDGVRLKFGNVVIGDRHQQRMGQPLPSPECDMPIKTVGKPQMKKGGK